jgi:hypothetical protein
MTNAPLDAKQVVERAKNHPARFMGLLHYESGPHQGQWRFVTEDERHTFEHLDEACSLRKEVLPELRRMVERALASGARFPELEEKP